MIRSRQRLLTICVQCVIPLKFMSAHSRKREAVICVPPCGRFTPGLRVSQREWLTIASIAYPNASWCKTSINPGIFEDLKSMPRTAYSGLYLVHILYKGTS
jgi:hypothetical protein